MAFVDTSPLPVHNKPIVCCREPVPVEGSVPARIPSFEGCDDFTISVINMHYHGRFLIAESDPPGFIGAIVVRSKEFGAGQEIYLFAVGTASVFIPDVNLIYSGFEIRKFRAVLPMYPIQGIFNTAAA